MPWDWLHRWWHGPRFSHWRVTLYTRQGCHLCETARAHLERARRRYGFTLEAVDVDTDAELAGRYGTEVPVVTVNGKVRFRGGVNPVLLDRLFRAAAKESGEGG
jgi:glutaredoxin